MTIWQQWLIRPYIWRELPGWGKVYERFVGGYRKDPEWGKEPRQTIRGKLHGYEMELDLSRWSERATFFLGRFYDLATQMILKEIVRPGDRVVDIGANIGMISLYLSRLVGPQGVVDSFEPNPRCASRIRGFIEHNKISNIRVHEMGIADKESVLTLSVPKTNTGEGTFTAVSAESVSNGKFDIYEVPVKTADAMIATDPRPPAAIKIDVEGFEIYVIKGLLETLRTHKPFVITEVIAQHLKRAGMTCQDVFDLMAEIGYKGYNYEPKRTGLNFKLEIVPASPNVEAQDVLWVPDESAVRNRLTLG